MNAAAGESYQDRVRYYRRQAEQARTSKQERRNKFNAFTESIDESIDFDEALYNFKQSSGFDRAYAKGKAYAKNHAKRHAFEHLSFYRDDEQGYIGGVCAGIADKMRWNVTTVRAVTVVLGLVLTLPTVVAYIAGTVFLRKKNLAFYGRDEHSFWKSGASRSAKSENEFSDAKFENEENV